MKVLDKVGIWKTANDNHVLPDFVFAAQSRIKQRVGSYDPQVIGMRHCHRLICSALSHYKFMMESFNRPDLYDDWKASREESIEKALTSLEDKLHRQGLHMS